MERGSSATASPDALLPPSGQEVGGGGPPIDGDEEGPDSEWLCVVPGCGRMVHWWKVPMHVHDPVECRPREGLSEADIVATEKLINRAYNRRWQGR
jgi:hypothetical protein